MTNKGLYWLTFVIPQILPWKAMPLLASFPLKV
jgi:hypothetical protein